MTGGKNTEFACQKYFSALTIAIQIRKKDEGEKKEKTRKNCNFCRVLTSPRAFLCRSATNSEW